MNDKGETRDDLRIPEGELGQKIRDEFGKEDITVIVSFHVYYTFIRLLFLKIQFCNPYVKTKIMFSRASNDQGWRNT